MRAASSSFDRGMFYAVPQGKVQNFGTLHVILGRTLFFGTVHVDANFISLDVFLSTIDIDLMFASIFVAPPPQCGGLDLSSSNRGCGFSWAWHFEHHDLTSNFVDLLGKIGLACSNNLFSLPRESWRFRPIGDADLGTSGR